MGGNRLKSWVENLETNEEATAFVMSNDFQENPVGTDYDPADLLRRLEVGESEIGARPIPAKLDDKP